jgi:hypothetical protein
MHPDPDHLALAALGAERLDAITVAHLTSCAACRDEYDSLRDVVDLGRESPSMRDRRSDPPRVWDGIMRQILAESALLTDRQAAALAGLPPRDSASVGADVADDPAAPSSPAPSGAHSPVPSSTGLRRRGPRHATTLALTAAIIAVAGALGIVAAVRSGDGITVVSRSELAALPPAPAGARGSAELVKVGDRTELRLTLQGLPPPSGHYEAWLFDPATGTMHRMGPVRRTGGTVPVAGIDLRRYSGIDVSAQTADDNGGYGHSMLRGVLN